MRDLNKSIIYGSIIVLVFIGLFFSLGYHLVFSEPPFGYHFMRQTDSLAFVAQYYNRGFHFFEPALFNLRNEDAKAACEFPIFYYITSLSYLIFGKVPAILKTLNLITVYAGIFYTIKLAKSQLPNQFLLPLLIGCFLFTSTVVNDYAFNYLPDAGAFGFVLIGIYFMYSFLENAKQLHGRLGLLFFALSGLIKVTYCIYPIAFLVLAILIKLFRLQLKVASSTIKHVVIYILIALLIVAFWNAYVIYYNDLHQSTSFLTRAVPIWEFSSQQIDQVLDSMIYYWGSSYMAYPSMIVLAFLLVFQILFFRQSERLLSVFILIAGFGSICYFLLFFIQFRDHDYYALVFYPIFALIIVNGWKTFFNTNFSKINFLRLGSIALFLLVVLYGIRYSRLQLNDRRLIVDANMSKMALQINQSLPQLNTYIEEDAKVVVVSDHSQNGSLFFLNREGWIVPNSEELTSERLQLFKNEGADYLIGYDDFNLGDTTSQYKPLMKVNGIQLYKLND